MEIAPTPFRVELNQANHGQSEVIVDAEGMILARIPQTNSKAERNRDQNHARLFAASPKLLQACKAVMRWWTETEGFEDGEDEMPPEIFDGLRGAIASAEGGAR